MLENLSLSKEGIRRIVKKTLKEEGADISCIGSKSLVFLESKMIEFCQNLVRNSIVTVKNDKMKTLQKKHLVYTLNCLDLVLKNIPKVNLEDQAVRSK